MKKYKVAAIIIIIHGLIEILGVVSVLPILLFGVEPSELVPFDPPPVEILVAGIIWGIFRLIGGIGLFKDFKWALVFSVINCVIAMASMFEMLPFGLMDAALGGAALILILMDYFGRSKGI